MPDAIKALPVGYMLGSETPFRRDTLHRPRKSDIPFGDGCYHHPTCETCPFEDCIFDGKAPRPEVQATSKAERNQQIVALWQEGHTYRQIGEQFGLTPHGVYKVLREERQRAG